MPAQWAGTPVRELHDNPTCSRLVRPTARGPLTYLTNGTCRTYSHRPRLLPTVREGGLPPHVTVFRNVH